MIFFIVFVYLPTHDKPEGANEVAEGKDDQNHSHYPEEVPEHDPPHDFVMIGELLPIFLGNLVLILYASLHLRIVECFDQQYELLWGHQLKEFGETQKLEKLQKLLGFSVRNEPAEGDDGEHVEYKGGSIY